MILDHVTQRARFLIVSPPALDSNRLGGRDLHVIDVAAVPQWLENAVPPAEREDVLHRFLAEIMIDAVNLGFGKDLLELLAERAGAGEVVAEGFFHNQPPPAVSTRQTGGAEALRRSSVLAGLGREIKQHVAACASRLLDL